MIDFLCFFWAFQSRYCRVEISMFHTANNERIFYILNIIQLTIIAIHSIVSAYFSNKHANLVMLLIVAEECNVFDLSIILHRIILHEEGESLFAFPYAIKKHEDSVYIYMENLHHWHVRILPASHQEFNHQTRVTVVVLTYAHFHIKYIFPGGRGYYEGTYLDVLAQITRIRTTGVRSYVQLLATRIRNYVQLLARGVRSYVQLFATGVRSYVQLLATLIVFSMIILSYVIYVKRDLRDLRQTST